MLGFFHMKGWYRDKFRTVPGEIKHLFIRESTLENLGRLGIIAAFAALIAFLSLIVDMINWSQGKEVACQAINQVIMLSISLAFVLGVPLLRRREARISLSWLRIGQWVYISIFLFWGNSTSLDIHWQDQHLIGMLGALFIVSSLLFLGLVEMISILVYSVCLIYLIPLLLGKPLNLFLLEELVICLSFISAIAVSRLLYYSRLHSFVNWENISRMNSSLKREIHLHMKTSQELEQIKNHLDKQVREKTRNLREANQRLQEEIAERNYSDKLKNVLYRISSMINRNEGLSVTMRYVHEQLTQIMNVTNFMVALYDTTTEEMVPLFQENQWEHFERYPLKNTLSRLVISGKESLLLNQNEIRKLAQQGEVKMIGIPAHSWLGVPLLLEDQVIGLIIAQSYLSNHHYDTADQKLLEYVGEHLSLAIDRVEIVNKLLIAKDKAEESDRLKSAFLSNLSHEVRTPLNAIVGFTEILAEGELTFSERQFYSTQVMENGQRLLSTLTNMVELAKIQSDQLQLNIEGVDANQILEPMVGEANQMIQSYGKKGIEVKLNTADDAENRLVAADFMRLKQLLLCLVENAVKFTHSGRIEFGCQPYNPSGLLVYVKDTGIGMSSKELNSIFTSFNKGINPGEKFYTGPGLGLSIVKSLVENMKGSIWAESEPNKGSCFFFTLPFYKPGRTLILPPEKSSDRIASDERFTSAV